VLTASNQHRGQLELSASSHNNGRRAAPCAHPQVTRVRQKQGIGRTGICSAAVSAGLAQGRLKEGRLGGRLVGPGMLQQPESYAKPLPELLMRSF